MSIVVILGRAYVYVVFLKFVIIRQGLAHARSSKAKTRWPSSCLKPYSLAVRGCMNSGSKPYTLNPGRSPLLSEVGYGRMRRRVSALSFSAVRVLGVWFRL